ncbi:uncharacterized protein MONOS_9610 [Monocercomonoides exilis]|uniref:uncharacterized protein n=1 Tax=Monocercomonoides exilis TaxID=2049356 RepID=UPI0035599710|nr:hypothetical protein MONOS_9610 [Monocercomonoides exilis]|eukprot:MONOS_9610.1-p1 / transcript=MONOS_9610.1 / gene=MONOS_9610 / organism=Monocercomonoides_exilis_PA203 / gene_product=unspecified product / transcript_product=unspecified product / location=Mono_scaffold00402:40402-41847(-) / protein_length=482 / sequence_SO=supercontig / SO=protein_coding / is_pseudo=false
MIRSFSSFVLPLLLSSAFEPFLFLFFCAVADTADVIQPLSAFAFLNAIVTLPISSSSPSSSSSFFNSLYALSPFSSSSTPHEPLLVSLLSSFLDISSTSIVLGSPCLPRGMQKLHVAVLFSSLFELLNSALNNNEKNMKWPGIIPARVAKSLGAVIKYQADVIMDVPRCLSVGGDDDDDDKDINELSGASPSSSSTTSSSSSSSSLNNLTKKRQLSLLPVSVALRVILNELSQLHCACNRTTENNLRKLERWIKTEVGLKLPEKSFGLMLIDYLWMDKLVAGFNAVAASTGASPPGMAGKEMLRSFSVSASSSSYLPSNIARCDSQKKLTSSHSRSNLEVELIQSHFVADEESRKAILSLIAAQCSGNEANTERLLHLLNEAQTMNYKNTYTSFHFTPAEQISKSHKKEKKVEKSEEVKYRGIVNPGTLCCINSLFEQLFMHTQLRSTLLLWEGEQFQGSALEKLARPSHEYVLSEWQKSK